MDYHSMMESIAEWMAAANTNGNLFLTPNGVQSQALSLTTSSGNSHQNNSSDNASNSAKTLSIRCVVESVPNVQYWNLPHSNGQIEVDRRANVPIHTVFHNLVEAVLQIFGYPKTTSVTAKGSIVIENWKPIRLEKIPMNSQKTVNDILGQISSFVTLRIQILRTTSCANNVLSQMKDKLLQLLIMQNIEHIMSSGCPLDQVTLKSILRGTDYGSSVPSDEVLRKFEQWISSQFRHALRPVAYPSSLPQFPYHLASPTTLHYDKELISGGLDDRVHPALQTVQNQYPTQKTRMRTSFDPELELPKLQKWFAENQHPDRQQIRHYVEELNSLESRRGRKPLDINNVVYWFKNARAAQKRAETRAGTTPAGILNSMNGYRSDSHSPCDTALTSKESLGSAQSCDEDYIEDDDNRSEGDERDDSLDARPSSSPVAPLSLTTHKDNNNRSRNSSPIQEDKQKPPDKVDRRRSRPLVLKQEAEDSPANHLESESEDEEMDEDASETESVHKANSEAESKPSSVYANSSPLSLIPRSVNNSLFPVVPNYNFSMFSMSQYMPSMAMNMNRSAAALHSQQQQQNSAYAEDKRGKRNRTFIDPVTEVPCLERWFLVNTHPSQSVIRQYTEDLNSMPYRQKFPPLKTQNVQFWFKNRRAKCKRLKTSLYENLAMNNNLSPQEQYHQLTAALSNENYRSHD